ncbi:hypothetical protein QBC37DRAFT_20642 [Rhypophila decipiens]|uniref:Glutaminase n=1 Tax=Rhypophila decipiens TaxID=261697 RepID=A0AAN6Y2R1_9PEZI|nr:hypothetical protein QBC37DRAFT_20642 [Rhypophila decipiens]
MRPTTIAMAALSVLGWRGVEAVKYTPTRPPAVPLAVRSPYLNTWLQCGSDCTLAGDWPRFWTNQIQGWEGLVGVDGEVYAWLGGAPGFKAANQTSLEYTSTKSIFTFDIAGKVTLTVTFFSPVYPDDLGRQSLQFSYIAVKAKSSDGSSHKVQIYMDVSAEFASGDLSQVINWETKTSGNLTYHRFYRANKSQFAESGEIASWGDWYLTTGTDSGLTYHIGQDNEVRANFANKTVLPNTIDSNFRAVNDNWPVFAFSHDVGSVKTDEVERLFTLGLIQDQVINFAGQSGQLAAVPGLWQSFYQDDISAVVAFYNDYGHATSVCQRLDGQIKTDSESTAGQDYSTITTLSVRQTFGALQFAGTGSKPYVFLKEISSNSDIQTVDVIFPALPIFMYLNATLTRYLLDPLFENQESGAYPNKYAEHDLGTFPVAKGYPAGNDEPMPLEECGNMIIMSLAYAQRAGDVDYLKAHFAKLSQWAEFLVEDSLIPANQLSTDDFAGTLANQTNLAIKGIIGLKAMSQIASLTKNEDKWGQTAVDYLAKWKVLAINNDTTTPHTTLSYGDKASHGLLYNIYADKLLSLNFIDQEIYDMQSNFYPTVALEYAVPLDTRHTWTKSDWQLFAAAVASDSTKKMFISKMAAWIGRTSTNRAMTDLYDAGSGAYPEGGPVFVARPVVGGTFALLALPK